MNLMEKKKLKSNKGNYLDGVLLITPNVFEDDRGYFYESWNKKNFNEITQKTFLQDNHSRSFKGVLRGLHYQLNPYPQGKLVRVIKGEIYDVIVDLRRESKTFSKWAGIKLNSDIKNQLWIPHGFAHGFLTLSNFAEINYKTTDFWYKEYEMSIIWNDKNINIKWPFKNLDSQLIINQKDNNAKEFSEISKEFLF